jgi:hypothetical protein
MKLVITRLIFLAQINQDSMTIFLFLI